MRLRCEGCRQHESGGLAGRRKSTAFGLHGARWYACSGHLRMDDTWRFLHGPGRQHCRYFELWNIVVKEVIESNCVYATATIKSALFLDMLWSTCGTTSTEQIYASIFDWNPQCRTSLICMLKSTDSYSAHTKSTTYLCEPNSSLPSTSTATLKRYLCRSIRLRAYSSSNTESLCSCTQVDQLGSLSLCKAETAQTLPDTPFWGNKNLDM